MTNTATPELPELLKKVEQDDYTVADLELAKMVMSDCGVAGSPSLEPGADPLAERIAKRIYAHRAAQPPQQPTQDMFNPSTYGADVFKKEGNIDTYMPIDMSEAKRMIVQLRARLDEIHAGTSKPELDVVRVCPERDIECGINANAWCATCPERSASPLRRKHEHPASL